MERPVHIVWFERIIFVTLALGMLNTALTWQQLTAVSGPTLLLFVQGVILAVMVTLTLLISRRHSKIAKWVMVGLFLLGLPMFLSSLAAGQHRGVAVIVAAQVIGQAVAYGLLFTSSSRRWFKGDTAPT
jgi:RsiW-degrading membrane proteinase PrsW (M82 family)